MERGLFITGTDTGVGKTYVTVALAGYFRSTGIDIGVMKPVESGCSPDPEFAGALVPSDALALIDAAEVNDRLEAVNPYRFKEPISPNIAARINGVTIEIKKILEQFEYLKSSHDRLLVEGAGGFLTPISDQNSVADLALSLRLPVVIVAANRLGCINATLLTIEAVEARGLSVAGVVLNNEKPEVPDEMNRKYNLKEITRLTTVPVLGEIPYSDSSLPVPINESIEISRLLQLCKKS